MKNTLHFLAVCCVCFFLVFFSGTGAFTAELETTEDEETVAYTFWLERHDASEADATAIMEKCRQAMELCRELFLSAETENSPYYPSGAVFTQQTVDNIEALLADHGYPVVDSDGFYPSNLQNADGLTAFLRAIEDRASARQDIVYVSKYGQLDWFSFFCTEGSLYCVRGSAGFDEDGNLSMATPQQGPVLDLGLTDSGYFYYQLQPLNNHAEAYSSVLTAPPDQVLYDLCAKYILPVGYQGNNLFLLDWDSADYGSLSFNDLLEYLYLIRHDYLDTASFSLASDGIYSVPAEIFEDAVLPYFDISLEQFRAASLHDAATDTYPWQRSGFMNVTYFPPLTPYVSEFRENGDGTITITVDVLCFDLQAFPLFTHEVTIRPHDDGRFQYLANAVTYKSGIDFPNTKPRLSDLANERANDDN